MNPFQKYFQKKMLILYGATIVIGTILYFSLDIELLSAAIFSLGGVCFEKIWDLLLDNGPQTSQSVSYVQISDQTDEEKYEMYMKLSKEEISRMLVNCNKYLDNAFNVGNVGKTIKTSFITDGK